MLRTKAMNRSDFRGKVVVITGSSRGIGKGLSIEFARLGACIVLNGRNEERLTIVESEIRKFHHQVLSVCCDVSTAEGGKLLIESTVAKFAKIDILINNAGISMRGHFADLDPIVVKKVFETNVLGAVNPSIYAIRHLRITKGSIVFISSLAGIRGLPGISAYCSSKMALRALAESIRIEERNHHIHVGLIMVAYTENDDFKSVFDADGSTLMLQPRKGKGVQSLGSVVNAVIRNIERRRFITVLSFLGKLNYYLQARFPKLVEYIIKRNIRKFEERGQ
jgi:NAD(P)-dependent dehydrogenase (short-subunit alcohol dehydrogenase family)